VEIKNRYFVFSYFINLNLILTYFIMSKSFRRHKKSSKRRTRRIKNRSRKLRSCKLKGGNGEKVKCCICGKMVPLKDTFVPRECLMKHGKAAHRICKHCWWDPKKGFALESSSHKCPGCEKCLPLTQVKKEQPIVVDLTEDE
jgi:hypothetical protein